MDIDYDNISGWKGTGQSNRRRRRCNDAKTTYKKRLMRLYADGHILGVGKHKYLVRITIVFSQPKRHRGAGRTDKDIAPAGIGGGRNINADKLQFGIFVKIIEIFYMAKCSLLRNGYYRRVTCT